MKIPLEEETGITEWDYCNAARITRFTLVNVNILSRICRTLLSEGRGGNGRAGSLPPESHDTRKNP